MGDTVHQGPGMWIQRDSARIDPLRTVGEELARSSPGRAVPRLYERLHEYLRTTARTGRAGETTEGTAGLEGASAILVELVASLHDARGAAATMAGGPEAPYRSGDPGGGQVRGEDPGPVPALLAELHGAWLHAAGHTGPRCAPAPSEIPAS